MALTQHTGAEPVHALAFQDTMEMASSDGEDYDAKGTTLLLTRYVSGSTPPTVAFH